MTRYREDPITLVKAADLVVVALAFGAAVALAVDGSDVATWPALLETRVSIGNALFVAGYLYFWYLMLRIVGLYRSYRLAPAAREVGRVAGFLANHCSSYSRHCWWFSTCPHCFVRYYKHRLFVICNWFWTDRFPGWRQSGLDSSWQTEKIAIRVAIS